jgi:hypothetical protein
MVVGAGQGEYAGEKKDPGTPLGHLEPIHAGFDRSNVHSPLITGYSMSDHPNPSIAPSKL